MGQTAKLFQNGKSQAVRLPKAYRFEGTEVNIRKDEATGDVILSKALTTLEDYFLHARALRASFPDDFPDDFLSEEERRTPAHDRDPFADWPFADWEE